VKARIFIIVALAGCMSDARRIREIQSIESEYALTQLLVSQLRERQAATKSAQASLAIGDTLRSLDSALIAYDLKLKRLRK
jgi:hypothetical protein